MPLKMPERITQRAFDPTEHDANVFAREILMPEETFKQVVRATNGNIKKIASAFKVPNLAVRFRAKDLGIKGHGV